MTPVRADPLVDELDAALVPLATHAAVPVAIDPAFVHLLRTNFFLDGPAPLPYSAEWQLLLSPVCREVGGGMYEIPPDTRRVLLERLQQEFGPQRVRDVATLLWRYAERSPWPDRLELERAQQVAALGWVDPHRAQAWLQDSQPAQSDAVDHRWFVAMREEVGAMEQASAAPASAAPAVDLAAFTTALLGLNYRAQERMAVEEMRAHRERAFLVHGPPGHGQSWLVWRLIGKIPGGLASLGPAVVKVPLDNALGQRGRDKIGELLAMVLTSPAEASGSSNPWRLAASAIEGGRRAHAVVVIFDGVDRIDAGVMADILEDFRKHVLGEPASQTATASLFPLYVFLVDSTGATRASDAIRDVVHLPALGRFTHDDLVLWVNAYPLDLPPALSRSPVSAAAEILANSDGGVPERALEYLCWRAGIAWTDVLGRVESAHDRDPAEPDPARATSATLSTLAREYDAIRSESGPGEERTEAMTAVVVRMRAVAAVEAGTLSSLAQSSKPGDRLAAIAILHERPDAGWLNWLADRLRPGHRPYSDPAQGESPFVGVQAALAIDQAARQLADSDAVRAAIDGARARLGPGLERSDRAEALDWAEVSLGVRAGRWADQYSPLAREYDQLRQFETTGDARTSKMARIADQMLKLPEPPPPLMAALMASPSAGMRLQAIAALHQRPSAAHLSWLADRPGVEKWFVGYRATVALVRAAQVLDAREHDHLREILARARDGQRQSGDPDQAARIEEAFTELNRPRRSSPSPSAQAAAPPPRAHASPLKNVWAPGSVLRVKFIGGDPETQEFVRSVAEEWTRHANVRFRWIESDVPDDAEVRVSLAQDGAWAYLGTDALNVAAEQPTVELGYVAKGQIDPEARKQAVLRTFGHVLGLLNEHQNPRANLPWDKEAVYRDLDGPLNNWDRRAVDRNLLTPQDAREYPWYRDFDATSVMMPELSPHWFTTPLDYGPRRGLSPSDRSFIARLYPASGVYDDAIRDAIESGRGSKEQTKAQTSRRPRSSRSS